MNTNINNNNHIYDNNAPNILDVISKEFTLKQLSDNLYTTEEWDSLRIWSDTNSWFRFSRNIGGTVFDWIKYRNLNIEDLENIDKYKIIEKQKNLIKIVDVHQLYGKKIYHPYFLKRNINKETVNKFDLEVIENNIGIPLTDINGKRIGLQLRSLEENPQNRYLFYLLDEKPLLFPLHKVKEVKNKIILCEGTFSVLRWNQVINNDNYMIFGCLGNHPNDKLKELLNGINNLFCIYDPDIGGQKFRNKLKELFPDIVCLSPSIKLDDMTDYQMKWFFERYIK